MMDFALFCAAVAVSAQCLMSSRPWIAASPEDLAAGDALRGEV